MGNFVLSKIWAVGAWLFLLIFVAQSAQAGLCNSAKKNPCPKLINEFEQAKKGGGDQGNSPQDSASQSTSHCMQIKSNDEACDATVPFAITYTSMAAVCAVACFGVVVDAFTASAFNQACTWGSLANSLADFGYAMNMQRNGSHKDYVRHAEGMIGTDWGLGTTVAGLAGNGIVNALTNVVIGNTANHWSTMSNAADKALFGPSGGAQATTNAGSSASAEGGRMGADGVMRSTTTGTTTTSAGEPLAKGSTEAGAEAGKTAGENTAEQTFDRVASCVSMVTNAALASVKWYDFVAIQNGSQKEQKKIQALMANSFNQTLLGNSRGPGIVGGGGSDGSGGGGISAVTGAGVIDTQGIADATKNLISSNGLQGALKSGELKKFQGNIPNDVLNKSLQALGKAVAPPEQLVANAAANGVGATLAKIASLGSDKGGMKDFLGKLDAETAKAMAARPGLAFATAGVDGASTRGPSSSFNIGDMLGKKGDGGGAKVQEAKFGGFDNDIWHAGATKSLFEIVSDKTQRVGDRVGR